MDHPAYVRGDDPKLPAAIRALKPASAGIQNNHLLEMGGGHYHFGLLAFEDNADEGSACGVAGRGYAPEKLTEGRWAQEL